MTTVQKDGRWLGIDQAALPSIGNPVYQDLLDRIESGTRRGIRITCPHCRHMTVIRTSRAASRLTRESQCACQNPACGHVFRVITEVVETIVPSGTPDPSIFIPSIYVRIAESAAQGNGE